jgi:NADH:ubiquinone reductase (non-electrogenic)
MEPIRNFLRHKKASVQYYEAEATKIDYEKRIVHIDDSSDIKGDVSQTQVPFDMLVIGVGAENATFGGFEFALDGAIANNGRYSRCP